MHFTKPAALLVAIASPIPVTADGCHNSNDSIGKFCKYFSADSFSNAAATFCNPANGISVLQGQSYGFKTDNNPDGAGGQQIFWGNYRVDRGGAHKISSDQCKGYMSRILSDCGGYGGWIDTDFGTVFGECIRR